jgi:hypothetical protein
MGVSPLANETFTATGDVAPERVYVTFTSVENGQSCSSETLSIVASANTAHDAATAANMIVFFIFPFLSQCRVMVIPAAIADKSAVVSPLASERPAWKSYAPRYAPNTHQPSAPPRYGTAGAASTVTPVVPCGTSATALRRKRFHSLLSADLTDVVADAPAAELVTTPTCPVTDCPLSKSRTSVYTFSSFADVAGGN